MKLFLFHDYILTIHCDNYVTLLSIICKYNHNTIYVTNYFDFTIQYTHILLFYIEYKKTISHNIILSIQCLNKGGNIIFIPNQTRKSAIFLAISFEILFIYTCVTSLLSQYWEGFFLSLLGIICILIPFIITYIANKKNLQLPPHFQLLSLLFIFSAQYLGEFTHLYEKIWWWDTLLHGLFGTGFVVVGIYLCKTIIKANPDTSIKYFILFIIVWSFCFTLCLGTLWEIFEFWGDYFLNTHMVDDKQTDTTVDLSVKTLAALATSVIYYYKYKKNNFKQ